MKDTIEITEFTRELVIRLSHAWYLISERNQPALNRTKRANRLGTVYYMSNWRHPKGCIYPFVDVEGAPFPESRHLVSLEQLSDWKGHTRRNVLAIWSGMPVQVRQVFDETEVLDVFEAVLGQILKNWSSTDGGTCLIDTRILERGRWIVIIGGDRNIRFKLTINPDFDRSFPNFGIAS